MTETPNADGTWPIDLTIERLCSPDGEGQFTCPINRYCGHPSQFGISLSDDGIPDSELINYGITTFDNIGIGMITIFQVITLEGWTVIMYNVRIEVN
jgi:hypothetical protein